MVDGHETVTENPIKTYDELLARADSIDFALGIDIDLVRDMASALRAALAKVDMTAQVAVHASIVREGALSRLADVRREVWDRAHQDGPGSLAFRVLAVVDRTT